MTAEPVATAAETDVKDVKDSKDHPRVSRFKGTVITRYQAEAFGQLEVLLSNPGQGQKVQAVEGTLTKITYAIPKDRSTHEVYRSYVTELEKAGFNILYKCAGEKDCGGYAFPSYFQSKLGFLGNVEADSQRYLAARRHAPTGDTFVMLYAYLQRPNENRAVLAVVDVAPLNTGLVTVNAEAMARDITSEGRAIVYGVFFDTDSATLKPDSDAALNEMAKLLGQNGSLRVFIVGHTDNVGPSPRNLDLSQKRADSVVKALTGKYHVDPKRLEGRGVGPLAPIATNRTTEGRAKNRRVELVER